jgi:hypothetical protein
MSKTARQHKREYLPKLEEDNRQLKDTILQFEQKNCDDRGTEWNPDRATQVFPGHLPGDGAPEAERG